MSTALITGAAGGIGAAISRTLAAEGHDLLLGWVHGEQAAEALSRELSAEYGVRAAAVHIDLSKPEEIGAAYRSCAALFGEPDILINNGGAEHIGLFQDMTDGELLALMNTDLAGAMLLTKHALPAMISAHRGYIINIASVWGEVGASCEVAYSAAKAGLIGFTKALGKELAPAGVRVNCVSPGFIDTRMNGQLSPDERKELIDTVPASRAGTPEDVAAAVKFLLSGGAEYICGQVLRVDGGWI
ncbi:MAG: 3-oxoacyl-ACP reductase FabG [Ruminococcus sp.]|nr:3-oxoacyl-ACP reductase FabG [Ruminococcus sp.]